MIQKVVLHTSVFSSLKRLSLISRGVGSRYCMFYYFMQFQSVQAGLLDGQVMHNST